MTVTPLPPNYTLTQLKPVCRRPNLLNFPSSSSRFVCFHLLRRLNIINPFDGDGRGIIGFWVEPGQTNNGYLTNNHRSSCQATERVMSFSHSFFRLYRRQQFIYLTETEQHTIQRSASNTNHKYHSGRIRGGPSAEKNDEDGAPFFFVVAVEFGSHDPVPFSPLPSSFSRRF